jgi:hypothetical protein
VPIPAVTVKIASMKSKVLMADLLVLRCCLITNAEAAILFQRRRKDSLCFTGCGCTTHELVSALRFGTH